MRNQLNETYLGDSDKFRFRLLQAKAEFNRLRPGTNPNNGNYASTICNMFPDTNPDRARKVVSGQIIDEDILRKLERCNEICKNGI